MNATTAAVQGSGWGWLAYDPKAKDVCIVTCANQDPCSTVSNPSSFAPLFFTEHS